LPKLMDTLFALHPTRWILFIKVAQVGWAWVRKNWFGYVRRHVPPSAPQNATMPLWINWAWRRNLENCVRPAWVSS
jgi:hypothetical protein